MLPDQFIRVSVRGIGREIKEPQLAVEAGDERLGLFRNMRRPAVNDQKNLVLGPDQDPHENLNEHIGISAQFPLNHEPHMAARGDRRDQAHAIPRPCPRYNGGLPLPAPGATRMMIRAHVRGVAEVNLSLFPLRQSFDPWEFLLEPLLHQSFVPFQRTMQRLLAGDAELSQKPPDRHQAQRDIEFIFDQRCHHLARPQRKCELELQRILLRHRVVNPLQLLAVKFRRTPKQRFGLQRSPAATPILRQPTIDRRTIDAENISNNFRAFTILNTAHSTLTHRLQCSVIQSARIVCPHAQRESYSRRHVKKSMLTYVLINKRFYAGKSRAPKTLLAWARPAALQIHRWLPGRYIVLVADSAFAAIEFLAPVRNMSVSSPPCGSMPTCSLSRRKTVHAPASRPS